MYGSILTPWFMNGKYVENKWFSWYWLMVAVQYQTFHWDIENFQFLILAIRKLKYPQISSNIYGLWTQIYLIHFYLYRVELNVTEKHSLYMFLKDAGWLHYYQFYEEQSITELWHTATLFCISLVKHLESFACFVRNPWSGTLNLKLIVNAKLHLSLASLIFGLCMSIYIVIDLT